MVTKYRVWRLPDEEYKKGWWIHPSQIRIYPDGTIESHVWDGEWEIIDGSDIVIQNYTGLFDKNENEICEGDILECYSELVQFITSKPTGKYKSTIYSIEYKPISGMFATREKGKDKTWSFHLDQNLMTKYYTIIGNVCDHPELLENI